MSILLFFFYVFSTLRSYSAISCIFLWECMWENPFYATGKVSIAMVDLASLVNYQQLWFIFKLSEWITCMLVNVISILCIYCVVWDQKDFSVSVRLWWSAHFPRVLWGFFSWIFGVLFVNGQMVNSVKCNIFNLILLLKNIFVGGIFVEAAFLFM